VAFPAADDLPAFRVATVHIVPQSQNLLRCSSSQTRDIAIDNEYEGDDWYDVREEQVTWRTPEVEGCYQEE